MATRDRQPGPEPGGFERVSDLRREAEEALAAGAPGEMFGGFESEATNRRNEAAYSEVDLRPRVLVDSSSIDPATEVLGTPLSYPVMLAPAGGQLRLHPDGEIASAAAAGDVGTAMILSTFANHGVEEVGAAASGPLWFQLYVMRDRGLTRALVERAEAAGCKALVVTVDLNGRSREIAAIPGDTADGLGNFDGLEVETSPFRMTDHTLTWSDLDWLRSTTRLPLLLKGILTAEDARLCREYGVDGIVVSNHGGFSLSGAPPTIKALPEIVDAAGEGVTVLLDGGIRRGTDVLKALALGARAVLVGRPMIWGLAAGGRDGVRRALQILYDELVEAMLLCGVVSARSVPPATARAPREWGPIDAR